MKTHPHTNTHTHTHTHTHTQHTNDALVSQKNPREKTRRRSSGHLQYRLFGYQINGKQNSPEITNNQTTDDIRIDKQQV